MTEENAFDDKPGSLDEYIANVMPEIDQVLAIKGEALSRRPHRAACFIVEHCFESVEGKTKDGFLVTTWFGVLLSSVLNWYEHVFGDAMESNPKKTHTAVLLVRNTPTALEVPLSFFSPLQVDGTRWLTLASDILPDEDPLSWLVRPPKLSLLEEEELRPRLWKQASTFDRPRTASSPSTTSIRSLSNMLA